MQSDIITIECLDTTNVFMRYTIRNKIDVAIPTVSKDNDDIWVDCGANDASHKEKEF